jgi:hypothetical protein
MVHLSDFVIRPSRTVTPPANYTANLGGLREFCQNFSETVKMLLMVARVVVPDSKSDQASREEASMGKKKAAKKWTKQDFGEITRPTIFDPGMVDKSIRQAVSLCWMMLPPEKRTPENIEAQIRRTVDRVLSDLKEDIAAFNITPNTSTQS